MLPHGRQKPSYLSRTCASPCLHQQEPGVQSQRQVSNASTLIWDISVIRPRAQLLFCFNYMTTYEQILVCFIFCLCKIGLFPGKKGKRQRKQSSICQFSTNGHSWVRARGLFYVGLHLCFGNTISAKQTRKIVYIFILQLRYLKGKATI